MTCHFLPFKETPRNLENRLDLAREFLLFCLGFELIMTYELSGTLFTMFQRRSRFDSPSSREVLREVDFVASPSSLESSTCFVFKAGGSMSKSVL